MEGNYQKSPWEYEIPASDHETIDIVDEWGTLILAANSGTVRAYYFEPFYGSRIVVDNGRSENGKFICTRYFHLSKRMVHRGEIIGRGQQIGTPGSSGMMTSYPHLHY
ncbi:MAG: M23 family metallopeptidase [Acidiferrobacterales bacterium]